MDELIESQFISSVFTLSELYHIEGATEVK